jgi:hypothetical protein
MPAETSPYLLRFGEAFLAAGGLVIRHRDAARRF